MASSAAPLRLWAALLSSPSSPAPSLPFFLSSSPLPRSPLSRRPRRRCLLALLSRSPPPFSELVTTALNDLPPYPDFGDEIARLNSVRSRLQSARTLAEKLAVLESDSRVRDFFDRGASVLLSRLERWEVYLLKCLVAAGQQHVLGVDLDLGSDGGAGRSALKGALYTLADMVEKWSLSGKGGGGWGGGLAQMKKLLKTLDEVERFYDCIGGIIG